MRRFHCITRIRNSKTCMLGRWRTHWMAPARCDPMGPAGTWTPCRTWRTRTYLQGMVCRCGRRRPPRLECRPKIRSGPEQRWSSGVARPGTSPNWHRVPAPFRNFLQHKSSETLTNIMRNRPTACWRNIVDKPRSNFLPSGSTSVTSKTSSNKLGADIEFDI